MNKTTASMMVLIALVLMPGMGRDSVAGVAGSVHDFSTGGTSGFQATNEDEVCIFCHTPHGGVFDVGGDPVPLWNKDLTLQQNATYQMYGSETFLADIAPYVSPTGKPLGISLLCLSCHDGVATSEINTVINYSPDGPILMPEPNSIGELGFLPSYRNPNIGQDLRNDHPISILYSPGLAIADGGLEDPTLINSSLKLFNSRLECATCHDPHEDGSLTGKAPFLRMSNAGSDMCRSCHLK